VIGWSYRLLGVGAMVECGMLWCVLEFMSCVGWWISLSTGLGEVVNSSYYAKKISHPTSPILYHLTILLLSPQNPSSTSLQTPPTSLYKTKHLLLPVFHNMKIKPTMIPGILQPRFEGWLSGVRGGII
jgi:hypothetical protein